MSRQKDDDPTADLPRSEKDRMLAGELYFSNDPELTRLRTAARAALHQCAPASVTATRTHYPPQVQPRAAIHRRQAAPCSAA